RAPHPRAGSHAAVEFVARADGSVRCREREFWGQYGAGRNLGKHKDTEGTGIFFCGLCVFLVFFGGRQASNSLAVQTFFVSAAATVLRKKCPPPIRAVSGRFPVSLPHCARWQYP